MNYEHQESQRHRAFAIAVSIAAQAIVLAALWQDIARHHTAPMHPFGSSQSPTAESCTHARPETKKSTLRFHLFSLPLIAQITYARFPVSCLSFTVEATPVSRNRLLEEQFERILKDHGPAISRLAASYERINGIREELVQEIAFAVWQALPHFRGECSERTFVFRIAHNRALSHVWKRRPPHEPIDDLEESRQPIDPRPRPDQQVTQLDQHTQLMSAMQSLPLVHRQIIVLLLEGLTHSEIGEVLGITENNVGVRLSRARRALKQVLGVKP